MAVTLSLFAGAGAQFFDNNGNVLSGGKIYTYQAGTTTPLATYTTNSESAFHTNPIILDSAGRVPSGGEIWLQLGVGYKFVLTTSTDVLIATYDNIPSSAQPPAANDADSILYEQGYTVTAGSFVVGKIYRITFVGTTNFTLIGAVNNTVGTHFIATGAGTGTGTAELSQTVEAKLRQTVSIKDFGAVCDGVTDDATAVNAAITAVAALGGGNVLFPAGTILVGATIGVADNVHLCGAGQKVTTIKLKPSADVNIIERKAGAVGLGMGLFDLTIDGNQLNNTQGGVYLLGATDQRGPSWQIERVRVTKCRNSVMGSGVKAAFFIGLNTWNVIRDIEIIGNDYAQIAIWIGAADGIVDGLYLGTNGYNFGSTAYGLFVTSAGNFFSNCYFGGTQPGPQVYFTGAAAAYNKFVNCIFDNSGKNGITFVDSANNNQFSNCQIGVSSYSDGGTYYLVENGVPNSNNMFVGVKFYSLYGAAPATHAYYESPGINGAAQLIGCEFAGTYVTSAVQIPTTSTTQFVGCKGYDTTNVGTLKASTKLDVVGPYPSSAPSTSSVPLGRFNGGNAISLWASTYAYQYTWLQGIQDDGSNTAKPIYLNPLGGEVVIGLTGHALRPNSDNAQTLGTASERWSVVYAGTGTINTSDAREKQQVAAIDDAVLRAWAKVEYSQFRFNDAVAAKGDGARLHFGLVAQRVKEAFESEGLDAFRYGLLCYDQWGDKYEDVYDGDGKPTGGRRLVAPAGSRYGIRYEEALALECAYLRSQLTKGANNG